MRRRKSNRNARSSSFDSQRHNRNCTWWYVRVSSFRICKRRKRPFLFIAALIGRFPIWILNLVLRTMYRQQMYVLFKKLTMYGTNMLRSPVRLGTGRITSRCVLFNIYAIEGCDYVRFTVILLSFFCSIKPHAFPIYGVPHQKTRQQTQKQIIFPRNRMTSQFVKHFSIT